jgi:phenylpropionate dioxygenase-like ring-hydroxylating dioxygenase large terminal subunit
MVGPPRSSWYVVATAAELRRAGSLSLCLIDEEILVSRDSAGLIAQAQTDHRRLAVRDSDSLIWVCLGDPDQAPPLPTLAEGVVKIAESAVRARCDFDQAVLGLVDPAHVPMIHKSWWWRPPSKGRRVKTKAYAPSPYGFTARAVDEFASAPIYELAGQQSIEIEFRLPSVRNERILGGRIKVNNLTTITPLGEGQVMIRNLIYADKPWLRLISAPLSVLGARFLRQDAQILQRLETIRRAGGPLGLFAGDPDRPSLWYYQLKSAHAAAEREGRGFLNPVRAGILRWLTCWLLCLPLPL